MSDPIDDPATGIRDRIDKAWAGLDWHRDPAASGWRTRVFLKKCDVRVYDDGEWIVHCSANNRALSGLETSHLRALRTARRIAEIVEEEDVKA